MSKKKGALGAPDKYVALCDNAGIVQVNNLYSGNLLFSLSHRKNKMQICTVHLLDSGKLFLVAGCMDGTIIFFYQPPIDNSKET